MFATYSVDKFSFPSGHATRAVALALFFTSLYRLPAPLLTVAPLWAWAAAVCGSRVLLGRHHLLDVAGGILAGLAEGAAMSLLWMGEDTATGLAAYFFGDDPWSNA